MLAFDSFDGWKYKAGAHSSQWSYKWTSQQGKYEVHMTKFHKLRVTVCCGAPEIWRKFYSGRVDLAKVEQEVKDAILAYENRILEAKISCWFHIPYRPVYRKLGWSEPPGTPE